MRTVLIAFLIAGAVLFELAPASAATTTGNASSQGAATAPGNAIDPGDPATEVLVAVTGPVPAPDRLTPARLRKVRAAIRAQARALGVTPVEVYTGYTRAFSARVSGRERSRLEADPRVLEVIDDDLIEGMADLDGARSKVIGRPASERLGRQITPKWLRRLGVLAVDHKLGKGKHRRGFDADVAIIDSGINRNHPDVRPVGGKDCTHSGGWRDAYGHGLGVASILGARDNGRGIVGMLPGVRLWSVRIFDAKGRTRLSWVLCGLDWVASKRDPRDHHRPLFEGATLSFSLGGSNGSRRSYVSNRNCGRRPLDLVHQAICRIERQGTILVAAAGNYGQKAGNRRPAGYQEVITVSAMADFDGKPGGKGRQVKACRAGSARERDDRFASFSSYGAGVDLIAPGKCIWVAYKGKAYARVSGTSFAAPMVLGAALLYRKRYPKAKPNQVRQALIRAGRLDWRTGSDPDRSHEPRVDVRHFAPPPVFDYTQPPRRTIRRGGGTITLTLRPHRQFGHTARVRLRTTRSPKGVRVIIDGTKVTIKARSAGGTGSRTVTLRASDGEVVRTIHVQLRLKPARR
jgi:subtilisin